MYLNFLFHIFVICSSYIVKQSIMCYKEVYMYWKMDFLNIYIFNKISKLCPRLIFIQFQYTIVPVRNEELPSRHRRQASFPSRCGGRDVLALLVDEEGPSLLSCMERGCPHLQPTCIHADGHLRCIVTPLFEPSCQKDHVDGEFIRINMSSNSAL